MLPPDTTPATVPPARPALPALLRRDGQLVRLRLVHRLARERQREVDPVGQVLAQVAVVRAARLRRLAGRVRRHGGVDVRQVDDAAEVCAGRVDRRIQIFDQSGKHLDTWYQFSRISGIHIAADDTLYAIDSESDDNFNPGWRKGLRVGSAKTGEVWYFVPEHVSKQASGMGGFGSMGEGVTADAQGNVYAGEVGPIQGLTKFVPRLKK